MAKLSAYHAKRDFGTTAEPKGEEAGGSGSSFVVQKHDASRLHYDLRLELDGVMKSWAVAKGPSLVPGEKRLAVHVEDHPIAYNTFEGTIPQGQYGGGTVMIWDRGRWEPEHDPHKGYAKGHLDFRLEGEKLGGAWHLVRMRKKPRERQEAWLLIKSDDEFARAQDAPDVLDEHPLSVATGRSLDEIASAQGGAVWQSNRGMAAEARSKRSRRRAEGARDEAAPAEEPKPSRSPVIARSVSDEATQEPPRRPSGLPPSARDDEDRTRVPRDKGSRAGRGIAADTPSMPTEIEPCLATLVSAAPAGERWLHEIKWDGYRLVAFKADATRLATRRGLDWTARFPGIAEAVAALPARTAILDGEAVIEDEHGISSFSALQDALSGDRDRAARGAIFYAFDLLWLDGADLRGLPLSERKARLAELVPPSLTGTLRFSEHVEGDGGAMVRSACQLGLEGVIAKRRDRPYRAGRGEDWVKVKCTDRQELVIGGYVPAAKAKNAVGSLALGFQEDGALHHAGRAGTGFTAQAARDLFRRLTPLKRATSPFAKRLTALERRGIVYVEPVLVAEIEFRGWTADRNLRQAAYKGLREDKSPDEVVREMAEPSPEAAEAAPAARPKARPAATPATRGGTRIVGGEVAGVALTHPERVLWDSGVTKQGLAEFYESIADRLLPHLVHRPLSLVRCPGGAAHGCFFQKHSWAGLGPDIRRESVRDEGAEEEILYVEDIRGVVSLVQAGVLEIHPWGTTVADVERPDRIVMDLDPGDGVTWADVVAGARDVRERLDAMKLDSFVKTTGGKGLHVVVPLTGRSDWAEVKGFAKALADAMATDSPGRYIAKATKAARRGLIYVDYLRNGRGATAIAPYSTRARPGATVSVPVAWEELGPSLRPDQYNVTNLGERLDRRKDDPWAGIEAVRQGVPAPKARSASAGRSAAGAGTSPGRPRSPRTNSR